MHLNWRMLLGGDLRGTLPNPRVIVDGASQRLAAMVFGPKTPAFETGTGTGATGGTGGGTAGALELIENHDFASAATSHTFSGLDGDVDEVYLLVYQIIKNTTSTYVVDIRPNGLTTNQETRGRFDGTGGSGALNATTLRIVSNGGANLDDVDAGWLRLHARSGQVRVGRGEWVEGLTGGGGVFALSGAYAWNDTGTNITSLDVVCDQASGIKAGSYVRLYRLNKS